MYIKFTLILIISILSNLENFAQDPYFSNYSANLIYLNPAFVSSLTGYEASVTYRNQWPGLKDAFVTYGASFSAPMIKYKSGLGFHFLNDVQGGGIITSTSVNTTYAYRIKFNPRIFLNAGLRASYYFKNLNADNLIFESDINGGQGITNGQDVFETVKSTFWDFSLGFMAEFYDMFDAGFSIQHITQPGGYFSTNDNNVFFRSYSFHASGKIPLVVGHGVDPAVLRPSILFQKCKQHHQLVYGSGLSVSSLSFGLWLKNDFKFSFSSLTALAGFIQPNYKLSYSYDINLTRAGFLTYKLGAHEVTFQLTIRHHEKRRKHRAIKYPRL